MQVRQLHGDYFVSAQLSTDGIRLAAEHGVRTIINNRPDHEEPGQPLSEDLQRAAEAAGLVYRHLPFASADIPEGILGALRDGYADMLISALVQISELCIKSEMK